LIYLILQIVYLLKEVEDFSCFRPHISISRVRLIGNIVFDLEFLNSLFGQISIITGYQFFRIDIEVIGKKLLESFDF